MKIYVVYERYFNGSEIDTRFNIFRKLKNAKKKFAEIKEQIQSEYGKDEKLFITDSAWHFSISETRIFTQSFSMVDIYEEQFMEDK